MKRELVLAAARNPAAEVAVALLERLLPTSPAQLSVLTYHRVGSYAEDQPRYPGLLSASTDDFATQMEYVAHRRRTLSGDELIAVATGNARLPPRATVVTFDDAYRDFGREALPVLRRLGIPAILFVPTAYPSEPDRGFWWDRLFTALKLAPLPLRLAVNGTVLAIAETHEREPAFRTLADRLKSLPHGLALELLDDVLAQLPDPGSCHDVMGWDEIRALPALGVAVAPHSRTHPRLDRLDSTALREEVDGSRADLERELRGATFPMFAYPDGGHDANVVRAVSASGHRIAFTTVRGTNDVRTVDWLRVRRINVGPRSSLALIRAQLLARAKP